MFEKIGRLAETSANKVSLSRRGFLGRLGQGALATAGALGGLLALPKDALAGDPFNIACVKRCCEAHCGKVDLSAPVIHRGAPTTIAVPAVCGFERRFPHSTRDRNKLLGCS